MNRTLIPHPRFSLATPAATAREIMLAAACLGLKAQVVDQAAKITALEERNRQLTKALHRTACAGHVLLQVIYFGSLLTASLTARAWLGAPGVILLGIGLLFGAACVLLAQRSASPRHTSARRRVQPAHLDEPDADARLYDATFRATPDLAEAYADESEFEPFEWAVHHPEAQAARARFEATAARLS